MGGIEGARLRAEIAVTRESMNPAGLDAAKVSPLVEPGSPVSRIEAPPANFLDLDIDGIQGRRAFLSGVWSKIVDLIGAQIPFHDLVYQSNLFDGKVRPLVPQTQGKPFILGSRPSKARDYVYIEGDRICFDRRRSAYLTRGQVNRQSSKPIPNFYNLSDNSKIGLKQAKIVKRGNKLLLSNLTNDPLVWAREGSEWKSVALGQELPLEDGTWILLGADPLLSFSNNTVDPQSHTVLRVEYAGSKAGDPQWNLIEFKTLDLDDLEKNSTRQVYLAALLGRSEEFVTGHFGKLFQALEKAGWEISATKALFGMISSNSPVLAERNISKLTEVLDSAQRSGWNQRQLEALLFDPALGGRIDFGFLNQLPGLLEESAALKEVAPLKQAMAVLENRIAVLEEKPGDLKGNEAVEKISSLREIEILKAKIAALSIPPEELIGVIIRMAEHDGGELSPSFKPLFDLLRNWRSSSNEKPRLQDLIDFLDRAEVTIELLRDLFSKIPGGEKIFLEMMHHLIPVLQGISGFGGSALAELSAEILTRIVDHSKKEALPPAVEWVATVLGSLPDAFGQLFGLSPSEQRATLLGVAKEQGVGFPQHWAAFQHEAQNAPKQEENSGRP